jgi:uncharacterized protein with HEPN domain
MSPRGLVYVTHMLDHGEEGDQQDPRSLARCVLRLALIHLIQVICEAGREVSREFSDRHSEMPWADTIGMRHKVVHDYLGVDEDIVWQVVHRRPADVGGRARTTRPADASRHERAMTERCIKAHG